MKKAMKKMLGMALGTAMVLSLPICANAANEDISGHLRILYPGTSELELDMIDLYTAKAAELYPNLEVEFITLSWSDIETKLSVMVQSKDYPDLMMIQDVTNPVAMGALEPLDEYLANSEVLSKDGISEVACDILSVDGTLYAVPFLQSLYSHVSNTELLAQAGIDYAEVKTWDDYVAAAEKINALGDGIYGYGMNNGGERFAFRDFLMMCLANGIQPDDTSEEAKQAYIETLGLVKSLAPYISPSHSTWLYPELFKAWENGEVGMMHSLSAFTANVVSHGSKSMHFTQITPLPAGPSAEETQIMVGGVGYAMIAGSEQKEAAWAMMEILLDPEIIATYAATINAPAIEISDELLLENACAYYGEEVGTAHVELVKQFNEAAEKYGVPMPKILGQSEMEKVVQAAIVEMIDGDLTPEDAYEQIKAGIDPIKEAYAQ